MFGPIVMTIVTILFLTVVLFMVYVYLAGQGSLCSRESIEILTQQER